MWLRSKGNYVWLQASQANPIWWMEGPALAALKEAEMVLCDHLWAARHVCFREQSYPNGRSATPAAWDSLRAAMGAVLEFGTERVESARYWSSPSTSQEGSTTPTPSTSREPVMAECPICFERPTQVLRPCGHVVCATCIRRIGRCPICKRGFSHSIDIFFS